MLLSRRGVDLVVGMDRGTTLRDSRDTCNLCDPSSTSRSGSPRWESRAGRTLRRLKSSRS